MKKIIIGLLIVIIGLLIWNVLSQPKVEQFDLDFGSVNERYDGEPGQDFDYEQETQQNQPTSNTTQDEMSANENTGVLIVEDTVIEQEEECSSDNCPASEGDMIVQIPILSNTNDIIFINRYVPETPAVLNSVYAALFDAPRTILYGEFEAHSQGSNPTQGTGLSFDGVSINNSVATVNLSGDFTTQEIADFYFRQQINQAAFQYDSVNIVEVFLNGERFDWCITDQSGGENGCPDDPRYWIDAQGS
jgi:hypothetical protein